MVRYLRTVAARRLKHDIVQVGHLANGINLYRFVYNGGHIGYVGVIAQEVQSVAPAASRAAPMVTRESTTTSSA
jgi:hypothetical protein